jgi:hypothetical protein
MSKYKSASVTCVSLVLALAVPTVLAADCTRLHAEIVAVPTTIGCTSPVGQCIAGTIDGNRRLQGTTFFTTESVALGPATAPNPAATVSYAGTLQIATSQGNLTAKDTGILDASSGTPTSGLFSSFDVITGGTGRFAGATGVFQIRGRTVNGKFFSDINGEICFP